MDDENPASVHSVADLERQHGIPADTYCGLSPEAMSRAIVAYHSGPREPGKPIGYWPVGSEETSAGSATNSAPRPTWNASVCSSSSLAAA